MAPNAMQINTPAGVAAVVCVASITITSSVPELCVLLGLLAFAMVPAHQKKAFQQFMDVNFPKLSAMFQSTPSKACALLSGAALLVAVLGWSSQTAIVILSAASYVLVNELNRIEKNRRRTPCQATVDLPPSPSSSASSKQQQFCPKSSGTDTECAPESFDAEVRAFLRKNMATPEDEVIVSHLIQFARDCILPVVPEADISAIATGNLRVLGASNLKPEVHMTVTVDPSILSERLKALFLHDAAHAQKSMDTLLPDLLLTTAAKVLSDRLKFAKFWHSQFNGPEPKVVLQVPSELGLLDYPVYLNFTVNSLYPLRLLTVCDKERVRADELGVLVTHWARQRCIANIAKGQPHTRIWGLLVAHFWQFGSLAKACDDKGAHELFHEFVDFYSQWLVVAKSQVEVPVPCTPKKTIAEQVVPYIEDPFHPKRNLVDNMTADGLRRVQDELVRAGSILARGDKAKLSELLERWMPPSVNAP